MAVESPGKLILFWFRANASGLSAGKPLQTLDVLFDVNNRIVSYDFEDFSQDGGAQITTIRTPITQAHALSSPLSVDQVKENSQLRQRLHDTLPYE